MSVFGKIDAAVIGRNVQPRGIVRGPSRPPHYPDFDIGFSPRISRAETIDVETSLDRLAAKDNRKLNWHRSIVDLMKLVGLEATLDERQQLASELGYRGDGKDFAAMDVWLHRAVIKQLSMKGETFPCSRPPLPAKTAEAAS